MCYQHALTKNFNLETLLLSASSSNHPSKMPAVRFFPCSVHSHTKWCSDGVSVQKVRIRSLFGTYFVLQVLLY